MSKQILVERKDTNLAHKLETTNKIPIEYTKFRDSILENLQGMRDIECKNWVPQLYNILKQAGLEPKQARAVVLKDGVELFHWSPITIDKAIKDPAAFNQVKAKAGRISADKKKQQKLVTNAIAEASHRGPGRPPKPVEEQWFKAIVTCDEMIEDLIKAKEVAVKAGTNKAQVAISSKGKISVSAYLVGGQLVTN